MRGELEIEEGNLILRLFDHEDSEGGYEQQQSESKLSLKSLVEALISANEEKEQKLQIAIPKGSRAIIGVRIVTHDERQLALEQMTVYPANGLSMKEQLRVVVESLVEALSEQLEARKDTSHGSDG